MDAFAKKNTYRAIIEDYKEEIEGYNYIDVDDVIEMLDKIKSTLDKADDLGYVIAYAGVALDIIIKLVEAGKQYVANEEIPSKLGDLLEKIYSHMWDIRHNLLSIKQTTEDVSYVLVNLSYDLR